MAKAKYIIRFDDICPSMNWDVWSEIENILLKYKIKPILAVVPDNQDEKLNCCTKNEKFWDKIHSLQNLGWTIALHGYQHKYVTDNSGIIGINNRSEFAGLNYKNQQLKLKNAIKIFKYNKIKTNTWVAPAHSFDENTIKILSEIGINIISDGYYFRPLIKYDKIWIPQQLWKFRAFPFGLWTICYHINSYNKNDIKNFTDSIINNKDKIISVNEIHSLNISNENALDKIFSKFWKTTLKAKRYFNL